MMKTIKLIALLLLTLMAHGQERLKVSFQFNECDMEHLKRQLTWIDYVRDQSLSDVHIWSLKQQNGSGGMHLIILFEGQKDLASLQYKLNYQSSKMKSSLEIQNDLAQLISIGLLPFDVQHGNTPLVSIQQNTDHDNSPVLTHDSWRNWVFDIGINMGIELETNRKNLELEGMIRAKQITKNWRIRSELEYDLEQNSVKNEDIDYESILNRKLLEGSAVRSLSNHWSAGLFLDFQNNSVKNTQFASRVNAALEFNFYPYSLSHQKEFTVAYYIGPVYLQFIEETIYGFHAENLMGQQLSIEYQNKQAWGSVEIDLEGFHYLNDMTKNRVSLEAGARFKILKGLSIRVSGEYQLIHDQIYLPKGSASIEEILLKRKSIATDYSFDFYVGLVYTFGSIYNSIVNTRL